MDCIASRASPEQVVVGDLSCIDKRELVNRVSQRSVSGAMLDDTDLELLFTQALGPYVS